ncbi:MULTISPECIES: DJ-1/PfpI family protein [unclassified Crossiella]|uniref:DJ-1/PfpI family protein n=1 Tax=unclassified Crossiella TaxID=2620835 RepID=UPI001FFFBC51|nr:MULTISPECIES: DJ-1/PfpI family protein [unclassified Crossiella]MCK2243500.1 DJ-1/PfpI family protein [Crossiella sp. S99.2]MCK2257358.1 DJ-1/PfpI family protein [Crossiella sp. S99.1]
MLKPGADAIRVDLALFDGLDVLDVAGPAEALHHAQALGVPLDIARVTLTEQDFVTCGDGTRWIADGLHRPDADVLIIPGGGGVEQESASGRWFPAIRKLAENDGTLVSVCTGAQLLVAAGVVGDRRITSHRIAHEQLTGLGVTLVDERVVDDGDLISSAGITAGIDLGLWLVERIAGRDRADEIAEFMEYPDRFRPRQLTRQDSSA